MSIHSARALAVVLLGAAVTASHGAVVLTAWAQCGGVNGCPSGASCSDAQWQGMVCTSGYSCVRQDAYWWQCKDDRTIPPELRTSSKSSTGSGAEALAVTAGWAQCGGDNGCPSTRTGCGDRQWAACPTGYSCVRQDMYYRQCKPEADGVQRAAAVQSTQKQREAAPRPVRSKEESSTQLEPKPVQKPADGKVDTATLPSIAREKAPRAAPNGEAALPLPAAATSTADPPPSATAVAAPAPAPASDLPVPNNSTEAPGPPVEVGLLFPDTAATDFEARYAAGTLAAVSQISGLPVANITSRIMPVSRVRRLLAAASGVSVTYSLTASDPATVLASLQRAAADSGAGLYSALSSNGVPMRPAMSLGGNLAVPAGSAKPYTAAGWPASKKLAVGLGVGIGVGGALLLAAVAACYCMRRKKAAARDTARKHEAEIVGLATTGDPGKMLRAASSKEAATLSMDRCDNADARQMTDQGPAGSGFASAAAAGAAAAALIGNPSSDRAVGATPATVEAALVRRATLEQVKERDAPARAAAAVSSDAPPREPWRHAAPWKPPSAHAEIPPLPSNMPSLRVPPPSGAAASAAPRGSRGVSAAGVAPGGTPTSLPVTSDPEQYEDALDGFATPRSDASFESACSGGSANTFASALSGGGSQAGSAATANSYRSAASRMTSSSALSGQSQSANARTFPRAFIPDVVAEADADADDAPRRNRGRS